MSSLHKVLDSLLSKPSVLAHEERTEMVQIPAVLLDACPIFDPTKASEKEACKLLNWAYRVILAARTAEGVAHE